MKRNNRDNVRTLAGNQIGEDRKIQICIFRRWLNGDVSQWWVCNKGMITVVL